MGERVAEGVRLPLPLELALLVMEGEREGVDVKDPVPVQFPLRVPVQDGVAAGEADAVGVRVTVALRDDVSVE